MSNVLNLLIDRAKEKADTTAQQMAKTQKQLTDSQGKLDMLHQYKDECHQSLHANANHGITGQQLRNQNAFVGKIDQAIGQQNKEIEFLQTALTHQKQQWQEALAEQKKFEALVKREQHKALKKENKRDQKMNDEFAARIYRVNTTGEHA